MKQAKVIRMVDNEIVSTKEFPILEMKDIKLISKQVKEKKGITLTSFLTRLRHSTAFAHNLVYNQSDCTDFLKELKTEGIVL